MKVTIMINDNFRFEFSLFSLLFEDDEVERRLLRFHGTAYDLKAKIIIKDINLCVFHSLKNSLKIAQL